MKTIKLLTIVFVLAGIVILTPAAASAHSHVSVGVGYHHGWHHGHWGYGIWLWPLVFPCYPPAVYVNPYPPVVVPPVVVAPPLVAAPPITVVPQYIYKPPPPAYNDFDKVRLHKQQLMDQLKRIDKTEKLQAIDQLAGFSFDDQVRAALENILLSDPDAALRKAVAVSFGKVKNQKTLPVLEKVRLADSDKEVREAADSAISRIKS